MKRSAFLVELWTLTRYSFVGIGATALHLLLATTLVIAWEVTPFIANAVGFCGAFTGSFLGQHYLAFRCNRSARSTILRFSLVAIGAFAISNLVIDLLLWLDIFPSIFIVVLGGLTIPIVSFIFYRLWVFGTAADQS